MNPTTVAHLRLSTLRRLNPAWEIMRGTDPSGRECWQATLRVEITQPMRDAGIVEVVRQPDFLSFYGALHRQAAIFVPFSAGYLIARPRTRAR
ncbi:hypothetical protein GCM10022224_071060 [Nonomuraea antimicrobica]|uniref:Uncharacterized protein n=1 Tax=Nonomuraea antimicrobica TaxID=561173 RepID=A0ABP7CVU6_9ACTN